jgi:pimeloyl-ACP methyl ester carboxylesterase
MKPGSLSDNSAHVGDNLERAVEHPTNDMGHRRTQPLTIRESGPADISIWKEAFFGAELLLLHASPIFYGFGVPPANGSAVVVIPGFLGSDHYLHHLSGWLSRIGYKPYLSGIGLNADCPNLLIKFKLTDTIERALDETGGKIHLIGHSLGGIMARSVAAQRPRDIASVITIASPFRGTVAHRSILRAAGIVRSHILEEYGPSVLPDCYTSRCTCEFLCSLRKRMSHSVQQTAIFTRDDGVVDWNCCVTGDPDVDVEVPGTHVGLAFNASVYSVIGDRLAKAR